MDAEKFDQIISILRKYNIYNAIRQSYLNDYEKLQNRNNLKLMINEIASFIINNIYPERTLIPHNGKNDLHEITRGYRTALNDLDLKIKELLGDDIFMKCSWCGKYNFKQ